MNNYIHTIIITTDTTEESKLCVQDYDNNLLLPQFNGCLIYMHYIHVHVSKTSNYLNAK